MDGKVGVSACTQHREDVGDARVVAGHAYLVVMDTVVVGNRPGYVEDSVQWSVNDVLERKRERAVLGRNCIRH